jgi:hypothetical protein
MVVMRQRPHTNDLFALFPDLPWTRMRTKEAQLAAVRTNVERTRARAYVNIHRQRSRAEAARVVVSARRRRR